MYCNCGMLLEKTKQAIFGDDTIDYYLCEKCDTKWILGVTNKQTLEVHAEMAQWKEELRKAQKNEDDAKKKKAEEKLMEKTREFKILKKRLVAKYRGKI